MTSQPLSGSKTHHHQTKKGGTKTHVVRPEWLFDSIAGGKRQGDAGKTGDHRRGDESMPILVALPQVQQCRRKHEAGQHDQEAADHIGKGT